jgi:hypothetical protein
MIARALDPNTRLNWTAVAVWSVAALWLLAAWSVPALLFSRGVLKGSAARKSGAASVCRRMP